MSVTPPDHCLTDLSLIMFNIMNSHSRSIAMFHFTSQSKKKNHQYKKHTIANNPVCFVLKYIEEFLHIRLQGFNKRIKNCQASRVRSTVKVYFMVAPTRI